MAWLRRPLVATFAAVLAIVACGPADPGVELTAANPVATTAPIGVPLPPTPTPLALPPALVELDEEPTPTPTLPPAPVAAADGLPAADAPTSTAPEVAEPAPQEPDDPPPTAPAEPEPEPTAPAEPEPTTAPTTEPAAPSAERVVTTVGLRPLGQVATIPLVLPVASIEVIGFHEASHPGSQPINAAATGVEMFTMTSRGRGTPGRSAADIVVPPGEPVFAPATGTVIAANEYVLYCEHQDQLVYIQPDGLADWQVRVFHVEGALVPVGTRVIAGETQIASSARTLPFESQVDEFTGEPSWPHVHIEVVDTTVPDTRPPGPGCP